MRCQTRYCNKTCQHDHWRRGHKQICKKIYRGGGAEQFDADKKYAEAATAAFVNEAVALLEEVDRTCEELYDKSHGDSQVVKAELKKARAKLARARKAVARRAAATAKSTAAGA